MAIASFSAYTTKVSSPRRRINDTKNALTTVAGRLFSNWASAPDAGAAPTTAAVPTNSTTGSVGQDNSTGTQRLIESTLSMGSMGSILIIDRLSHQGGLSGTVTTAQTTNLPTAALTRYTSGVGVFPALEIYTAIGATATTVTASYTDAALGSTTTLATVFGGTGFNTAGRFMILPLPEGGTGVTAVASVTVLATTATAGNFGVTLFRPIAVVPSMIPGAADVHEFLMDMGALPQVPDNSCLQYLAIANGTSTGILQTSHKFAED